MAGSIFKKLRGLLVKFWAKLQIVLHYYGLWVESTKVQGLFNKIDRRTGIYAYGPFDRDLAD